MVSWRRVRHSEFPSLASSIPRPCPPHKLDESSHDKSVSLVFLGPLHEKPFFDSETLVRSVPILSDSKERVELFAHLQAFQKTLLETRFHKIVLPAVELAVAVAAKGGLLLPRGPTVAPPPAPAVERRTESSKSAGRGSSTRSSARRASGAYNALARPSSGGSGTESSGEEEVDQDEEHSPSEEALSIQDRIYPPSANDWPNMANLVTISREERVARHSFASFGQRLQHLATIEGFNAYVSMKPLYPFDAIAFL